jgi:signal transduction histidine kinase
MTLALGRFLRRRRRYRELEGLHEISQAFARMTDTQETYGHLTRRLAEFLGCEKCVINLYEPETREFVCQAPGYNIADVLLLRRTRYSADSMKSAWNFRTQGPMVNKRPEEFNEEQQALLRPFGIYNLTEVPLIHEGRLIGKISIANKPGGLSRNDVRLVTVFAAQAAVVIQNARLYTQLQESAAQLEAKVQQRTAELQATYRELAASHARLREVDQLKSDFLGNVSHELRTPLAAVKGFVDNLLDGVAGPLGEKPLHYLGRVRDNADRLSRMVSDLLDLTRIEAGKIELVRQPLAMADVVTEAAESLRQVAELKGVALVLDLAPGQPMHGDPDKLHQVLTNLVSNAVKFSPRGGRVTVVTRLEPDASRPTPAASPSRGPAMLRLEVRDTGPGIAPEDRDRIFDKFYQVGRVDGERPSGTGLGLTIARHLVELHGGRVWVESGTAGGSTFVVLLPTGNPRPHADAGDVPGDVPELEEAVSASPGHRQDATGGSVTGSAGAGRP